MQYSAPVVEQNNNNEIKKGREYNEKKNQKEKANLEFRVRAMEL